MSLKLESSSADEQDNSVPSNSRLTESTITRNISQVTNESQKAPLSGVGNIKSSFRRVKARSSRACEVCHARKVRCDVEKQHPCTNCSAFGCDCRIPEPKRRRVSARRKNKTEKQTKKSTEEKSTVLPTSIPEALTTQPNESTADGNSHKARSETSGETDTPNAEAKSEGKEGARLPFNERHLSGSSAQSWINIMNHANTGPSGPTFLGSSSNVNLLLEPQEDSGGFHYSFPAEISYTASRLNELDNEEIEILKFRGAFLLPPRDLCDDIIEAYFEKIHPTLPYLNRSQFMRRYNDASNPPSLLLLQSMLLAGSRVCRNPALLDASGSADLASLTFYKRAKALFDANYELDAMIIVQSVLLMGWWWEGPEDVTKNSFYWSRVGLSIAQGFGLHRSVEKTNMPIATKRSWKRMWWTLFLRDRWVAVSLGRPVLVNLEDSDVPMLTEEDFNEDEPGLPSLYPMNRVNALYFIHSVKLSEIMGLVLRQQFSVNAENSQRQNKVPVVSHCDLAMGSWMNSLPPELKYSVKDKGNHNYFKALLHAQYYTVLCLVHRSNILRKGLQPSKNSYPSWGIAFQAAHMISRIFENLLYYDECRDCAAFYVYTLFSAMIMLLYQTESPQPSAVESAKKSLAACTRALKEVGKTWMVARMVLQLFKQLHQNKSLREQFANEARKRPFETAFLKNYAVKPSKANNTGDQGSPKKGKKNEWSFDTGAKFATKSSPPAVTQAPSQVPFTPAAPARGQGHTQPDVSSGISSSGGAPLSLGPTPDITPLDPSPPVVGIDDPPPYGVQNKTESSASTTWKNATSRIKQPEQQQPKMRGINNSNNILATPVYETPDFMMVTNNLPNSQNFYDNFQPSQLFPEVNDSGVHNFLSDEILMNLCLQGNGSGNMPTHQSNNQQQQPNPLASNMQGQDDSQIHLHPAMHTDTQTSMGSSISPSSEHTKSPDASSQHNNPMLFLNNNNSYHMRDWYHYVTSTFNSGVGNSGLPDFEGLPDLMSVISNNVSTGATGNKGGFGGDEEGEEDRGGTSGGLMTGNHSKQGLVYQDRGVSSINLTQGQQRPLPTESNSK